MPPVNLPEWSWLLQWGRADETKHMWVRDQGAMEEAGLDVSIFLAGGQGDFVLGLKDGKLGIDRAIVGHWKNRNYCSLIWSWGRFVSLEGWEAPWQWAWWMSVPLPSNICGWLFFVPRHFLGFVGSWWKGAVWSFISWAYCSQKNPERFSHKLIVNLLRLVYALLQKTPQKTSTVTQKSK